MQYTDGADLLLLQSSEKKKRDRLSGVWLFGAFAGTTFAEILVHLRDPKSPRHGDALAFLASRCLPLSAFNEVATELVLVDMEDAAPTHTVQVMQTDGPGDD